jgi:hypothetical protein
LVGVDVRDASSEMSSFFRAGFMGDSVPAEALFAAPALLLLSDSLV